ncbi:MAG: HEAT repeat domain-containing protein [Moorellaceae bacterium]
MITENREEIKHLSQLLETSTDGEMKIEAISKLAALGNAEAVSILARTLQEEADPLVREAVIGALLVCDTRAVVTEMARLLRSEDPASRSAAFEVLTYKGEEEVMDVFIQLLHDTDRDVRVMAVHALGRSKCIKSAELLRRVIKEDNDVNVVAAAVEYLGEVGEPSDAALILQALPRFRHPYFEWTARRAWERLKGDGRWVWNVAEPMSQP